MLFVECFDEASPFRQWNCVFSPPLPSADRLHRQKAERRSSRPNGAVKLPSPVESCARVPAIMEETRASAQQNLGQTFQPHSKIRLSRIDRVSASDQTAMCPLPVAAPAVLQIIILTQHSLSKIFIKSLFSDISHAIITVPTINVCCCLD